MRVRSGGRGCKGSLVSDSGFGFVERAFPDHTVHSGLSTGCLSGLVRAPF